MKRFFSKTVVAIFACISLAACVQDGQNSGRFSTNSYGAGSYGNNGALRVLVMGEDGNPDTMQRSSSPFRKVLSELKRSMAQDGFSTVDEEAVAANLGWRVTQRRPKYELMQTLKLMNKSPEAVNHARIMAVFSLNARHIQHGFGGEVSILVDGELYDIQSNQFLNSFDLPRMSFPAPANCNNTCAVDVVRDHAGDIAAGIGQVLSQQLSYLNNPQPAQATTSQSYQSQPAQATQYGGLATPYTLTMRRLDTAEALNIINTMAREFPGYVSHDMINSNPAVRSYSYTTSAPAAKLEEWLYILLGDMNMRPGQNVQVLINGTNITLERVYGAATRPAPNSGGRFQ